MTPSRVHPLVVEGLSLLLGKKGSTRSDSSSIVQHTETINRSGDGTAKGCVFGVNEGEYID